LSVHRRPPLGYGHRRVRWTLAAVYTGAGHDATAVDCAWDFHPAPAEIVWKAVRLDREGAGDFADALTQCLDAEVGGEQTMTFDRAAAKTCGIKLPDGAQAKRGHALYLAQRFGPASAIIGG